MMQRTKGSKLRKSGWRNAQVASRIGNSDAMKKEKGRLTNGRIHNPGMAWEDRSKLLLEVSPGKKGGKFELPFGGSIVVPPGAFIKKESVACRVVSPSERYKYSPTLKCDEFLLSELFLLTTRSKAMRKVIRLHLPFYPEPNEHIGIHVIGRRTDCEEWRTVEFERIGNAVQLDVSTDGVFVAVAAPRTETFEVPANGCLYNSRLSKQISVRFPKRAVDSNTSCQISIVPLKRSCLPHLARDYPLDMADLLAVSNYVDISCSATAHFRRAVTVKLPLPPLADTDDFAQDDMTVMHLVDDEWQLLEAPLKFTKSAVTFNTKSLARYCVALCRPQRRRRLREVFRHLRAEQHVTRGHILPFLHTGEKTWTLCFDAVSLCAVAGRVETRTAQGFRLVRQLSLADHSPAVDESFSSRRQRHCVPPAARLVVRDDLDLVRDRVFELNVGDDVRVCGDDPGAGCMALQYEQLLPESYRRFCIEPVEASERPLTGILRVYVQDSRAPDGERCVRAYDFDIAAEVVRAHRPAEKVPPPPALTPDVPQITVEPPALDITPVADLSPPPPSPPPPPPPPPPQALKKTVSRSFLRLIQPIKPPREAIRESKVLTGRSLAQLSRQVQQGLTLAIYLGISDSTITGMGFDALAMGHSLGDITYRILMLWKRRTSRLKNRQVDMLSNALGDMGYDDIAAILLDRHRQNLELTPDCFSIAVTD